MKRLRFRHVVGILLALIGSIALCANSYLLGHGALKWAHEADIWEQASLAAGGASVPWLLAIFPALFTVVVVAKGWTGRVGQRLILLALWAVFFFYNFMMGTSNIAKLREDKVAEHVHVAETADAKRDQRKRLSLQLAALPAYRPAASIDKLLEAERISKLWVSSGGCTDATAKKSRDFCDNYHKLEAEKDYALQGDKLNTQVEQLDAKLEATSADTQDNADPFVDGVSGLTGFSGKNIRVLLAMLTPFVLELMGASCWKLAIVLMGLSLKPDEEVAVTAPRKALDSLGNQYAIPSPEIANRPPPVPLAMISRQHELCRWFWRECARPIAAGSFPEREWFQHYVDVCRRQKDTPVSIESFRRIAGRQHGIIIQTIDGECTYQGYAPSIPNEEAVA